MIEILVEINRCLIAFQTNNKLNRTNLLIGYEQNQLM